MRLLNIYKLNGPKRFMAVFDINGKLKTVKFGQYGASTFIDHNNKILKRNYILRHQVREDFYNPITPGSLSRWILWNKPTLEESIDDYRKMFNI